MTVMTLTAEEVTYELAYGEQYTAPPEETETEATDEAPVPSETSNADN
jgi:hypothetical protein